MERKKLELEINQPTTVELLYDDPIVGSSKFGEYYLYAVKTGEEEFSFFAPDQVHAELKNYKKGETATITKLAAQRGTKLITSYDVSGKHQKNTSAITNTDTKASSDLYPSDNYFETMLTSFRDALRIQNELNGMVDPTRIAITLFIARSKMSFTSGN